MKKDTRSLLVCQGSMCISGKSRAIQEALEKKVAGTQMDGDVEVKLIGCHGFCQQGPLVIVEPEATCYTGVTVEDVDDIVQSDLRDGQVVERLLFHDPETGSPIASYHDIPFYGAQTKLLLRHCGLINPEDIDDYLGVGGYEALGSVLERPDGREVLAELKASQLRGRGGGGFPAWRKWEACLDADGDEKFVVCNADEGDPGAFMDRSILEGDPHAVLEGMSIAGFTVGARKGYIYVRAEYPLAVERLRVAIDQARRRGYLGSDILGSGFSFDVEVFLGAGAFVCGESTALTLSIEGKRGLPKAAPRPRTTEVGLFDKPTLLNNVKTFAFVPLILAQGGEWFARIGTEGSKGTATFALSGHVVNCGLIEVPMGITLRKIIYEIGGGVPEGKAFKAVQTGGPSGGCLPESFLDTPVDYDSLLQAGSMMGSGGMVVMNEDTCMVDVARYFLQFTERESCGQCVHCRLGTKQMLTILEEITRGEGKPGDVEFLVQIGEAVNAGSLCGLGQSAANPVLTTIRYFLDEYEAHIVEGRCPARSCKALISFQILPDKCIGCMLCAKACPVDAIAGERKSVHVIDQGKCIRCGMCEEACPSRYSAVERTSGSLAEGGEEA